jgi:hypothetical protein
MGETSCGEHTQREYRLTDILLSVEHLSAHHAPRS